MVKIAVSSDNHLDINKQPLPEILMQQAHVINELAVDYYLIAGDLFNDFKKSMAYVSELQELVRSQTKVYFIAGNHDMARNVSFEELETPLTSQYLHNKYIDIPNTNWRIIGHNGWYDYLFARGVTTEAVHRFKKGVYFDRVIQQPISDFERMTLALQQIESQLQAATAAHKQVIFFTHFAPINDELHYPMRDPRWDAVNGVLGSPRLGELLARYDNVQHVFYGHVHATVPPRHKNHITYYNASVGYNRHRRQEWTADNFLTAWQNKIQQIVLTSD